MPPARAPVMVSFAWMAACSLGDFTGYSSGGAPPAQDAGEDALDVRSDGGTPRDDAGVADAEAGTDATPVPFRCADHPNALLCTSFDEGAFDSGFEHAGSGTIAATSTFFTSAPRALLTSLPSRGPGMPHAALDRALPPTTSSFALSWDVRVVAEGTQTGVDLCSVYRSYPYWTVTVRYVKAPQPHLELFEYGEFPDAGTSDYSFTPLTRNLKEDGFTRIEIRVNRTGSSSSTTVLVDGEVAVTKALMAHLYHGTPHALLGIATTDGPGGAISVYTDNVLIEPL